MSEAKESMFGRRRHHGGESDKKASDGYEMDSKNLKNSRAFAAASDDLEEDSSTLNDNSSSKPPHKTSQGWGMGEEQGAKDKDNTPNDPSGNNYHNEPKRGRRRKGGGDQSDSTSHSSSGGAGDSSKPKNRHFDDDNGSTAIQEIPDLEEEEREPDITMQGSYILKYLRIVFLFLNMFHYENQSPKLRETRHATFKALKNLIVRLNSRYQALQ